MTLALLPRGRQVASRVRAPTPWRHQRALLRHAPAARALRAEETQAAEAALVEERVASEKAQEGIRKAYVGKINETRITYVCACCGGRNDADVGEFQLFMYTHRVCHIRGA